MAICVIGGIFMSLDQEHIESILGYNFRNVDLLQQAFVRRSYSEENGGQNNEVLEFIGDKALDFVVIKIMMDRFGVITETKEWNEFKLRNPKYFNTKKEGIFTDIKKELVQSKSLARVINSLNLQTFLIMGKGDTQNNIQDEPSVQEDLFEAIIGAVTVDSNWNLDEITEVVRTLIDFDAFFNNEIEDDNYTGELQRLFDGKDYKHPDYMYKKTNDGYRCIIHGHFGNYGLDIDGEGLNKASARNNAARKALVDLREHGYVINVYEEEVGEPSEQFAIKQLNELVQKKLISTPSYKYQYDGDEQQWICEVEVDEADTSFYEYGYSKKEAQRKAVYCLLKELMGLDNGED